MKCKLYKKKMFVSIYSLLIIIYVNVLFFKINVVSTLVNLLNV